jgi:hypothetical protein
VLAEIHGERACFTVGIVPDIEITVARPDIVQLADFVKDQSAQTVIPVVVPCQGKVAIDLDTPAVV